MSLATGLEPNPNRNRTPTKLSLAVVMRDLFFNRGEGEYVHFEELVLQVSVHFEVDERELRVLCESIAAVVRVERFETLPTIPIPGYCYEPASGVRREGPATLW